MAHLKSIAPGKIILSGEHAMVYGAPALGFTINRHLTISLRAADSDNIEISYPAGSQKITVTEIPHIKTTIDERYEQFRQQQLPIREVLTEPSDLITYCLSFFTVSALSGVVLTINSDIPIGSGMGSSAALILSIISLVATHLQLKLTVPQLYDWALAAENRQHGYSSGIDLQLIQKGGCHLFAEQKSQVVEYAKQKFWLIDTGRPTSSTGECVVNAKKYFAADSAIVAKFSAVTLELANSLQQQNPEKIITGIQTNHRLLTQIHVVPKKIQNFIEEFSAADFKTRAAKVCGAGACQGDAAGMVLAITDDEVALKFLCQQYNYSLTACVIEQRGVYVE